MNSTIANSSSTIDIPAVTSKSDSSLPHSPKEGRCQHIFPNGKRCRKFASGSHLGLCLQHLTERAAIGAGLQQPPNDSLDLSAELLPELSEFKCGVDINKFLARLLKLVTKGAISPRRAAVLAYITNQLLHSHRAIARENHLQPQEQGLILDFSDWPEPEDGSGIRGPACYRRAVLAGVAPREREKTQSRPSIPRAEREAPSFPMFLWSSHSWLSSATRHRPAPMPRENFHGHQSEHARDGAPR